MKKNAGSQNARNSVKSGFHLRPKVAALAVAACFSGATLANPTAPTVVHGTASFSQAGNILNVTNSHNAIINWGSFSIGVNELTKFIQPSALSAVLNRVTGQDPSAILGALQSNGRVFLLNPNGIVFGAGSQINVAGLVASTLNMSNADFLAGRMNFTDGAGAGSVINQGSINAAGGPVYMVGNAVTNNGIITSPGGEIVLAAGNSVELVNPGTPNLRVEIQADSNEARNLGSVVADAGRIGIYAGLIKQGGVINADSAVAEGGRIMLKSTKRTDLEAGSVTSARGTSGGQIIAMSGMTDGVTKVAGTLDASAIPSGAPGNGGFIETSAANVSFENGAVVVASASGGGLAGTWLIDPTDFHIDSGYVSTVLQNALNAGTGTNIDVVTANNDGGSIHVDTPINWATTAVLRLIAHGDVNIDNPITNNAAGGFRAYAGWNNTPDPFTLGVSTPVVGSTGEININAAVFTEGNVHLIAGGNINGYSPISASGLLASSNTGGVYLDTAYNAVDTIAGKAANYFKFINNKSLTVGTVGGVSGITVDNPNGAAFVKLELAGGAPSAPLDLIVSKNILAKGNDGGSAEIYLDASPSYGGNISVTNASVSAIGGDSSSSYGGMAMVDAYASNHINISGSIVEAKAGHGVSTGSSSTVSLSTSSGDISVVNGSTIRSIAGNGEYGGYSEVTLDAAELLTITGSTVASTGGTGTLSSGGGSDIYLYSQDAEVGGISIDASQILSTGGAGATGSQDGYARNYISSDSGSISITGGSAVVATGFYAYSYIEAATGSVTLANSAVRSVGKPGADGGEGIVTIYASGGTLNAGSGTISATGNPDYNAPYYDGNEIYLYGPGGVTLGTVIADRYVSVSSSNGTIVDGNIGMNIIAPSINLSGYYGVGTIDNPIETQAAGLQVYSGAGGVGVINSGNLNLYNLNAAGNAKVGATGSMTVDGAEGSADLSLQANGDINLIDVSIHANGNLLLNAGGNINIGGSYYSSAHGDTGTTAVAGGNLNVYSTYMYGGSTLGTFGSDTTVKTGGNVVVNNSSINGGPDVNMEVGGAVFVNGTLSTPGRIEAGSVHTITLVLTGLTSGGFSVNGVSGALYDALTDTGFFTDGSPAVLGETMMLTYTGASISPPTDTLIVAMNNSTKPPEEQQSTGAMTSEDEKDKNKKKDLPICGK